MEKLLTVNEVAEVLGMKRSSIYNLVFYKRIPCVKLSKKCLRFKISDIEEWVKRKGQEVNTDTRSTKKYYNKNRSVQSGKYNPSINRLIEEAKREVANIS